MIIYKTTNILNGKIYVGKDKKNDPKYFGSGLLLRKAINKYGIENFKKEILQECISDEELNKAEIYWINELNARDRNIGYNIAEGGTGGKTLDKPWNYGLKQPLLEETKKKISIILKEKYRKNEIVNPMKGKIPWNKGVPLSDEAKENLREKMTGKTASEETKMKISNSLKGKNTYKKSEEHKRKISRSLSNRKLSKQTREKMSKSRKGKKQKILVCPFCGKSGGTTMHRWHFDKCKEKKMANVKMVIAVRRDLNMRLGKSAAQSAHAAIKVFFDRGSIKGNEMTIKLTPEMKTWAEGAFTKIVVGVKSEDEVYQLAEAARVANIPYAVMIDNGCTEFHGVKTVTCIAIGPAESEEIDKITGKLDLL